MCVCVCVCLSVCLSVCLFVCLFVCLCVYTHYVMVYNFTFIELPFTQKDKIINCKAILCVNSLGWLWFPETGYMFVWFMFQTIGDKASYTSMPTSSTGRIDCQAQWNPRKLKIFQYLLRPLFSPLPHWPSGRGARLKSGRPGFDSRFYCASYFRSNHTSDLNIGTPAPCPAPDLIGSVLGLVCPVSVYWDPVR